MTPRAFSEVYERGALGKILESVYIAWIGTIIGAALSLPLAFLAAHNVAPHWVRVPIRQLFNAIRAVPRSEEHTSELQARAYLACRLLLEKKKTARTGATASHPRAGSAVWPVGGLCRTG